jgi:hypothetical protein
MGLLYTFGIALFAAIGTFLFGFDTGIATTSKSITLSSPLSPQLTYPYSNRTSKLDRLHEPPIQRTHWRCKRHPSFYKPFLAYQTADVL